MSERIDNGILTDRRASSAGRPSRCVSGILAKERERGAQWYRLVLAIVRDGQSSVDHHDVRLHDTIEKLDYHLSLCPSRPLVLVGCHGMTELLSVCEAVEIAPNVQ